MTLENYFLLIYSGNAVVKNNSDGIRDTAVLTVRGDGVDIPPCFILSEVGNASMESGRRAPNGEKPIKGMNNNLMKQYIDHLKMYVKKKTLLIMDQHSAHKSQQTIQYIHQQKLNNGSKMFEIELLPPKTAFLISPLDNGAISAFKSYYNKLDRSTIQKKKSAVPEAWGQVSNESLVGILKHCGYDTSESIHSVRNRFMSNVKQVFDERHLDCHRLFLRWKNKEIKINGIDLKRGILTEMFLQLDDNSVNRNIKILETR